MSALTDIGNEECVKTVIEHEVHIQMCTSLSGYFIWFSVLYR